MTSLNGRHKNKNSFGIGLADKDVTKLFEWDLDDSTSKLSFGNCSMEEEGGGGGCSKVSALFQPVKKYLIEILMFLFITQRGELFPYIERFFLFW